MTEKEQATPAAAETDETGLMTYQHARAKLRAEVEVQVRMTYHDLLVRAEIRIQTLESQLAQAQARIEALERENAEASRAVRPPPAEADSSYPARSSEDATRHPRYDRTLMTLHEELRSLRYQLSAMEGLHPADGGSATRGQAAHPGRSSRPLALSVPNPLPSSPQNSTRSRLHGNVVLDSDDTERHPFCARCGAFRRGQTRHICGEPAAKRSRSEGNGSGSTHPATTSATSAAPSATSKRRRSSTARATVPKESAASSNARENAPAERSANASTAALGEGVSPRGSGDEPVSKTGSHMVDETLRQVAGQHFRRLPHITASGVAYTKLVPDSRDMEAQAKAAVEVVRRSDVVPGEDVAPQLAEWVQQRLRSASNDSPSSTTSSSSKNASGGNESAYALIHSLTELFQAVDSDRAEPSRELEALVLGLRCVFGELIPRLFRQELAVAEADGRQMQQAPPYLLPPDIGHSRTLLVLVASSLLFTQWCLRLPGRALAAQVLDGRDARWQEELVPMVVGLWKEVVDRSARTVLSFLNDRFFNKWYVSFAESLGWFQWSEIMMKTWTVTIKRQLLEMIRVPTLSAEMDELQRRQLIEALSADGSVRSTDDALSLCSELLLNPGPGLEDDAAIAEGAIDLALRVIATFSNAKHALVATLVVFLDSSPSSSSSSTNRAPEFSALRDERLDRIVTSLKESLQTCSEMAVLASCRLLAEPRFRVLRIELLERAVTLDPAAHWEDSPDAVAVGAVPSEIDALDSLNALLAGLRDGAVLGPLRLAASSVGALPSAALDTEEEVVEHGQLHNTHHESQHFGSEVDSIFHEHGREFLSDVFHHSLHDI